MLSDLLSILFLGKATERFRVFTTLYLMTTSAFIANITMNKWGYYFNKSILINNSNIIDFLLSKEAFMVLTLYIIVCGIVFIGTTISLYLSSYLFIFFIKWLIEFLYYTYLAIMFCLGLIFLIITFNLKKIKDFDDRNEKVVPTIEGILIKAKIVQRTNGLLFQDKHFNWLRTVVQDLLPPDSRVIKNACLTSTILISTFYILLQLDLYQIVPTIYYIIRYAMIYYIFNSLVLIWLDNRLDYLTDILLTTQPAPPTVFTVGQINPPTP